MNKTTLVIASTLSALILVILGGIAYGVQARAGQAAPQTNEPALPAQALPLSVPAEAANPSVSQPSTLSPQEIAALAASYLNRSDVYSIESAMLDGKMQYLVTFSSGDIVRLDASGQVLGVESPQPASIASWNGDDDDDHDDDREEHDDREDHDDREEHDEYEDDHEESGEDDE